VTKATTFHNEYGLIEATDESIAAKMDTQRLFLRKGVEIGNLLYFRAL